jgi:hypothetical protein
MYYQHARILTARDQRLPRWTPIYHMETCQPAKFRTTFNQREIYIRTHKQGGQADSSEYMMSARCILIRAVRRCTKEKRKEKKEIKLHTPNVNAFEVMPENFRRFIPENFRRFEKKELT